MIRRSTPSIRIDNLSPCHPAAAAASGLDASCLQYWRTRGRDLRRRAHSVARQEGRCMVHAAGSRAALLGRDLANDAGHSGRRSSIGSVERRCAFDHRSCDGRDSARSAVGLEGGAAVGEYRLQQAGEHASDFKVLPDGAKEARYQVQGALNANGRDFNEAIASSRVPTSAVSSISIRHCSGPASWT